MAQISFSGKRELRWLQEGDCVITFVDADVKLADELWDQWLAAFVGWPGKKRLLTSWGDIQPSKDQWRRATRAMRDWGGKVAVVTESRATSALAKAASWAGVDMQAFRWEQLYEANTFLSIEGKRRATVRNTATTLRDCFGVVEVAASDPVPPAPPASPIPARPAPPPVTLARPAMSTTPRPEPPRAAPMRPSAASSGRGAGSKTPMADAAAQNLAQVRQTSEEIQAKLAEIQARLRNRTRS